MGSGFSQCDICHNRTADHRCKECNKDICTKCYKRHTHGLAEAIFEGVLTIIEFLVEL